MKTKILIFAICMFCTYRTYTQTLHDFTVTDVTGQQHRLYDDYLNKNKIVVIKFFFTTCPPCIANAPYYQQKYIEYGEGNQDVEFFSITTIPGDFDPEVLAFEQTYNQTMKGISVDGGALSLSYEFKDGLYGPWYGTPSFAVIAPDKTMQYPVFFNNLDNAITIARSKKSKISTKYTFSAIDPVTGNPYDLKINFFLKPQSAGSPRLEIRKNTLGIYTFDYPSDNYPQMKDPVIVMESHDEAFSEKISVLDVVKIQLHILGLDNFTNPVQLITANVNGDDFISASDLTILKRVILGVLNKFPNNVPSYRLLQEPLEINEDPGKTIELKIDILKMGNVN